VTSPGLTCVAWYPGETIAYGAQGRTVHWVFAQKSGHFPGRLPPSRLAGAAVRPGARSPRRARHADQYLDDSPEQTGTTSLVADVPGSGIGIYGLPDLLEVVEEADEDLHGWDHGPGGEDHPVRRRTCRPVAEP
jgi:hypothetical protein